MELTADQFAPRVPRQRYRIYRVRDGGDPELVATCRTRGSVGVTLLKLGEEGEFDNCTVGVLDGMDHKNDDGEWVGKWLLLPWMEKKKGPRLAAGRPEPAFPKKGDDVPKKKKV